MSWIKDNKFVVALGGGTLVGAVLLFFIGSKGANNYDQAKADFDAANSEASTYERLSLYPKQENRDGKRKALTEYRQSVESLQGAFQGFRPKELKNTSPQDFTSRLKAVDEEVRKAFENSGTKVADPFFCGFESYKTTLARGNATGILDYQLEGVRHLMLALAKSGASELKNLHRPPLPEEDGKNYTPQANDSARPLPLEITFAGPEKSLRQFLSLVAKPEDKYMVIRSIRIANSKKAPPRAADAKFDKPTTATPAATESFGGGFVLPGETPAESNAAKPETPAAPAADNSRILAQVLGNEEVQVFIRLDMMQFLPAKKLP